MFWSKERQLNNASTQGSPTQHCADPTMRLSPTQQNVKTPTQWTPAQQSTDPRNVDSTKHRPKERRLNNASTHGVSFETKNTCSRLYTAPLKTFKTENTAYYIILRCLRICRIPTSSSPIQYPNVHFFTTMQEPGGEMREAASMRRRPPRHLAAEAAPLLPGSREFHEQK